MNPARTTNLLKMTVTAILLLQLCMNTVAATPDGTLRQQMYMLHRRLGINFVYGQDIHVDRPYTGPALKGMQADAALKTLFRDTGISWQWKGSYIILKQHTSKEVEKTSPDGKAQVRGRRHTLSGYVRDREGEPLINATVYDLTSMQGTMTNEYGFFSITLAAGEHQLRVSYIGYSDSVERIKLDRNIRRDITLETNASLAEVVITGDMNSPLLNTQTGKRSLGKKDIQTEFNLMSSPDVVKTLQRTSGIAEGVELSSGLYVHGGGNDENLFLLDGTPLYQVNHTMGLFSSFNTDVVNNVDFYKSGFPARYGGRLSSVVDVRTEDGNMQRRKMSYRVGILDGSIHAEGPIVKGRTSYNIGLRRSWLDLLTRPIFAIYNHNHKDEQTSVSYQFHDLNAKLTHIFNDRSRIHLSIYSGNDGLHSKYTDRMEYTKGTVERGTYKNDFKWGNFNAAINWSYIFSPKFFANFTTVYTHNLSRFAGHDDEHVTSESQKDAAVYLNEHSHQSSIDDVGTRLAFEYRPDPHHHIRFGQDYTYHLFRPQTSNQIYYQGTQGEPNDTIRSQSSNRHTAHEINLYAEDEVTVNDRWSFNGGVNAVCFVIGNKTFCNIDPRLALKYQLNRRVSLKLSYTYMTQFVHKISNAFLDLPTDYWVPTTQLLKPMRSYQLAAGIYAQLNRHWTVSTEGYWKRSGNLLQYSSWTGIEPPAESWDTQVMRGRGRFYGVEFDAHYHSARLKADLAYTLSWSQRRFDDFYDGWYDDKFDNRHRLLISARYRLMANTYVYAGWTMHTGNKMTMPTQYAARPNLPSGAGITSDAGFIYERPNNVTLPTYHRLDVGIDFHRVNKKGRERIWNISFYNVYCHLNSMGGTVDYNEQTKRFRVRNRAFIPIIPSISYTLKF